MENKIQKYHPDAKSCEEVLNWFSYHAPKDDQKYRYEDLRNEAKILASKILCQVPACADRTAALRKLRECIMTVNAAIACNE